MTNLDVLLRKIIIGYNFKNFILNCYVKKVKIVKIQNDNVEDIYWNIRSKK